MVCLKRKKGEDMSDNDKAFAITVTVHLYARTQADALRVVQDRLEIGVAKDEHALEIKETNVKTGGVKR